MKIKKSHLKELIRHAISEYISEADDDKYTHIGYGKYKEKGKEKDKDSQTFQKDDSGKIVPFDGDSGGDTPKKEPSKPKITKIKSNPFDKEDPVQKNPADDPKYTGDDPFDIEDPLTVGDAGGPSYANVPKGAKSSAQASQMKKVDSASKDLGFKDTKDLVMNGSSDEIGELVDHDDVWESLPKDLHQPINNVLDFIRDNEMGMSGDPVGDELLHDYKEELIKMIQNPDGYGKEKETGDRLKQMDAPDDYEDSMDDLMKQMGDDEEISGMGAAEKANKKMEIDVLNKRAEKGKGDLIDTEQFGMVSWVNGDPDEDSFIATNEDGEDIEIDYDEIIRFHNDNDSVMKNLNLESIQKSKQRRFTVKEVRTWMKTLEENRYKKVYNSDCRRVSWMVNNMSENVENMPKSMRKKWTKAQYGRERYLAKEFLKSKEQKRMFEQKLRKTIRGILLENQKVENYSLELGDYIKILKPNIRGWKFGVERMTGSWYWEHSKFEDVVYATWGWTGKNAIPLQSSDGMDLGKINLKLKPKESLEDQLDVKKDVKKYIDAMKKELPKIQKKLLQY